MLPYREVEILRVREAKAPARDQLAVWSRDQLVIEEPLEIRLGIGDGEHRAISITMRTPGHDRELVAGFLRAEGVIATAGDLVSLEPCGPSGNVMRAELKPGTSVDLERFKRSFAQNSSCGVCGKSSLEALKLSRPKSSGEPFQVSAEIIRALPDSLRRKQEAFEATGGLHACGLFDLDGRLLSLFEDVGRHNALDKLVGEALFAGKLPLRRRILMLSGRVSFELVQKAAMAGLEIVAAVGAPSSLAVELARDSQMTLAAFVREGRFNIYCGESRITT